MLIFHENISKNNPLYPTPKKDEPFYDVQHLYGREEGARKLMKNTKYNAQIGKTGLNELD